MIGAIRVNNIFFYFADNVIAESGKRPVDSLFILAQSGTLVEYLLEPKARISSDKVTDESILELGVTGRMQWNLQRYL